MTERAATSTLKRVLRLALMATSATLAMGLALSLVVAGPAVPAAEAMVWLGLGMLVMIPVFNVIDVLMNSLRKKIDVEGGLIRTVRGKGFMISA